jgi:hypothetical protein
MNEMKKSIALIILSIFFLESYGQEEITQTIRGIVVEKFTLTPLPGANVILLDSDPLIGASSDINGKFKIENIPLGRVDIKISFIGYNEQVLSGLNLTSGKELILNIELEEQAIQQDEVVVSASSDKIKPLNDMASVSARSFTIEESERYAGSRNDVARMASNYAGVLGTNDSRNDIIIRGNSPSGLLWRLEGVDIPNPNHYGTVEGTGGPVSLLNNNQLANSDFMTGAFPAEYGNAISGVFDLKMRNGNDEKHEFLGQIGFNGFELGAEGPLSKHNGGSYLINYRYSTLELFEMLGINFGTGTAVPKYQDFSFKVTLPRTKLGSFSVFGLAGKSDISFLDSEKDTTDTENKIDFYGGEGFDLINGSDMATIGITHTYLINKSTYTKLTLAGTYHNFSTEIDSISPGDFKIHNYFGNSHTESKLFASFIINKKINSQHNLKAGTNFSNVHYDLIDSVFIDQELQFKTLVDFNGTSNLVQPYIQWQYRINNQFTLNSGLHYQLFTLNNTSSFEPRLGLKWDFSERQSLSFGYGHHSQIAPITIYFTQVRLDDGSYYRPNENLGMTKSQHFILGYDYLIGSNLRIKAETYFQYISNVGVDGNELNSYSLLNQGANFYVVSPDTILNTGTGTNYGIELTVEKFLSNSLYYLLTGSIFDSKYKGSDGIKRNTAFNSNYVFNGLLGKEWDLGKNPGKRKKKQFKLLIDIKGTYAGGQRYTPVAAEQIGPGDYNPVYDDENAFSDRFQNYFRTDLRIAIRQNNKKASMEFALDFQNLFNVQNIYSQKFNTKTGETEYTYQTGLLIIPQFRINF